MKLTTILSRLLALTLGVNASVATSVNAQNAGVHYFYNGTRVTLNPSSTEVLVKPAAAAAGTAAAMSAATAVPQAGIQQVSSPLPGWNKVTLAASAAASAAATPAGADAATSARSLVSSIASQPGTAFVSPVLRTAAGDALSPTAEIMVKYRAGQNPVSAFAALRAQHPSLLSQSELGAGSRIWQLRTSLKDGFAVMNLANALSTAPQLEFATPDFIQEGRVNLIPTDPLFSDTWGLRNTGQTYSNSAVTYRGTPGFDLDAARAWDINMGSSSVIVLVMDDGCQLNHPDFIVAHGRDFTGAGGNGGPVSSNDNHGTPVAACIAGRANNGTGSTGIAPGVRIAAAKIYSPDSNGRFSRVDSWVVNAINWGHSVGARISNSSWGGGSGSSAIDSAFQSTRNAGMVHFASAGNSNVGSIIYPASSPHVNAVGAAAPDGRRVNIPGWWGSNYGTGLKFMAPGIFMWAADRTGSAGYTTSDYTQFGGTSAAGPYAAGVAALIRSREPGLTPDQVTARMTSTCTDMGAAGYDTETGHGMLNAYRALGGTGGGGGTSDDHGNTTGTATAVSFPGSVNGNLEVRTDRDMFRFTVSSTTSAVIYSESGFDTYGFLYNSSGSLILSNDDGNGSLQFRLATTLTPGTYYVAIESYNQSYTGSYRIVLSGTSAAQPVMQVSGAGLTIPDGDTTPSTSDGTSFGRVTTTGAQIEKTFSIRNTGNATLTLTGSPSVTVTGSGASFFSVVTLPAATLSAGASSSFSVRYHPSGSGTHDATVSILSNDTTTSPYTFVVRGESAIPADDHGDTMATATTIRRPSNTPSMLNRGGDKDFFKFTLSARTTVVIETTSSIDTYGYLYNSSGALLLSDDDSGANWNFKMSVTLNAGTYYVRAEGYSSTTTGAYTLNLR